MAQNNNNNKDINIMTGINTFEENKEAQPVSFQPKFSEEQNQQYQNFVKMQNQQGNNSSADMLKSLYQGVDTSTLFQNIDILKESDHPIACIFHLVFKLLAFIVYIFFKIFLSPFTVDYIVVILCAFDFWTVKNVSGRLLVGLRWWSEQKPDGNDDYVFECKVNEQENNPINDKIFWYGQGIFSLAWSILVVLNVISFDIQNTMITAFACITTGTNLWAYYKCSKLSKNRLKEFASKLGTDMAGKIANTSVKIPLGGLTQFF